MKVLASESLNADSFFQQLDKLRMVYEEYIKLGKETIPLSEKNLQELNEELDCKSQALDDVSILYFALGDLGFSSLNLLFLLHNMPLFQMKVTE